MPHLQISAPILSVWTPFISTVYLSFLQGRLDFRFLLLNLLLDFLQLVDRLSSLCNLLREVRNLLCREG